MAYKGMVVEVQESMLHPHPNADRLQLLRTNGFTIIVSLELQAGDVGILFGTDTPGKLEPWFLQEHDLYARRDEDGKNISNGFFNPSGRVTSVNIRGVKSEGYFHVLSGPDGSKMSVADVLGTYGLVHGDVIDTLDSKKLCSKYYIRPQRSGGSGSGGPSSTSADKVLMPNLIRHYDTEQLRHHIHTIPVGAILRITLKLHGTSQRTGHVLTPLNWLQRTLARFGVNHRSYAYQSGTRKMALLDENTGFVSGKDVFAQTRLVWHEVIKEQGLPKGVTVYYEIVGYGTNGNPIMSRHEVDGESVEYHYGLESGQSQLYVYRITQQNEDGHTVDYSYEQVCRFCETRNLKVVPNIGDRYAGFIWDGDVEKFVLWLEEFCENKDPIGKTHPMEGVVIKVEHPEWYGVPALKFKGRTFVEAEGNAYSNGLPDIEEES